MIRRIQPQIVYVPHRHDDHYDHKVTNQVVISAVQRARWSYFPQLGVKPHKVSQIRAYEIWTPLQTPNLYVDITNTVALKEKAIMHYQSQLKHHSFQKSSLGLNSFRGLTGAGIAYAEAFELEIPFLLE